MNFTTALKKCLLPMLGGLVSGAYLGSLFLSVWIVARGGGPPSDWVGVPKMALGLSAFALLFMTPAALLLWWPADALLLSRGRSAWLSSAAIPLVVAACAGLAAGKEAAALVALYGTCFALVAHGLQARVRSVSSR